MPNGRITGYEVHYQEEGGGQGSTLSGIFTSVELTGLKPSTTYNISVFAINGAGNGEVTDIQGTTLANRKLCFHNNSHTRCLGRIACLTSEDCVNHVDTARPNTWMA